MNQTFKTLKELGLSDKEIKVYLAALELGEATIQDIAEKAEVKRTSIYNFLSDLKQKGLIIEAKRDFKNVYIAEDPHVLIENTENRIKKEQNQITNINEIIPELLAIYNIPGKKAKIKYFQGISGLKKIYKDTLIPNSTLYGFIDIDSVINTMGDFIFQYVKDRVKINMKYYAITKAGEWENDSRINNEAQKRFVKIVKKVQFDTEIDIYANKIAIFSFRPPYAGVIIEDQAIHNTQKSIWRLLWDNLK